MPRAHTPLLLLIAPLLLAWSAGGSGSGVWQGQAQSPRSVGMSGLVEVGSEISFVANATVDDGEALIFVTVPALETGRRVPATGPAVLVAYQEYAADGTLRFRSERPESGWVETSIGSEHATLRLDATWYDARAADSHRRWTDVVLRLGAVDRATRAASSSGGHGSAGAGCDATVAPDPEPAYDDSSGCEGDDWDSGDDDWDDDSGGGCESDDLGGDDSYDSDGGCEGDDLSDSSSDDSGASCEGDAIASAGQRRRSPTIVRLINQLPWLLVVFGLRLRRRRRRLG